MDTNKEEQPPAPIIIYNSKAQKRHWYRRTCSRVVAEKVQKGPPFDFADTGCKSIFEIEYSTIEDKTYYKGGSGFFTTECEYGWAKCPVCGAYTAIVTKDRNGKQYVFSSDTIEREA
jgi:hypothetical protein